MRRIGIPFESGELTRIRQAAKRRRLSVAEYIRAAGISQSDEDLGSRPVELEPYARRPAATPEGLYGLCIRRE